MIKWIQKALEIEVVRYVITGGAVTLTNVVGYFLLLQVGIVYTVANIISLILSKTVGYLLNKFWVYRSKNDNFMQMFLELCRFILARGLTGLLDFFGLIAMVELCGWNERSSKIVIMLLVIVLNYVLGKKAVFVKKGKVKALRKELYNMNEIEYNTGNYDKYNSKNPLKRWMVKRLNAKILAFVEEYTSKALGMSGNGTIKVLDAGCGEGFISNLIYTNIENVEVVGLEYTSEALKIARELNENIAYIQGDIYQMPFEAESFDLVLCTEVLEHLAEPARAVKELLRVAKGALMITVPNEPWFCLGNLLALKNVSRLGNPIDHINHWTFRQFKTFTQKLLRGGIDYDTSFPWSIVYYSNGEHRV